VPSYARDGATLRFPGDDGALAVTVCSPRIVRVEIEDSTTPRPSFVVPRAWPPLPITVRDEETVQVATSALRLDVAPSPRRLTLLDAAGAWLLREPDDAGMVVEATRDGTRRVSARFAFSGEQHFYGLGQGGGPLNRLGTTRQLWNTQLGHGPGSDMSVPLLVSNRGYAIFFDNPADGVLSVGRSDNGVRLAYRAETGPLVVYFLVGDDMRGVMREVAELLGAAPMPPRWALGFLQSTRHFESTAELRALPRTLRERRIPCDGLIYLSSYGEAHGWNRGVGHLEWQPELWSDPAPVLEEARGQHFEVITHEYPVLHERSPLFGEAEARGFLLTSGYERASAATRGPANYREGQRLIDFSNPAARAWWWEAHRSLVKLGVAGWWLDGGEGPPASARLHAGTGALLHNVYDRFRHQAFADGEAADRPDGRVFLLCRSGAPGMQRFGAACWSGDINNDFATLEAQLPLGLNTGLSGVPYWGTDVGGFFHPIPETGELYARWFQLAAFCPVFRSHGWVWREHVPWAHGPEVEAICRRYAELRYRLLPYTYTLAWQAHTLGLPLMRALVLNYPDDPRVWSLGHQFLWGDDLLIAPVTREGATAWPVYLPEGGWYDFWTGVRHEGPRGVTVDAPLDRLPIFVRAGAIVPLGPVVQHTRERPLDEITLLIYPEGASRFEMYEDDGRSQAYRDGRRALTTFTCTKDTRDVTVRIEAPAGDAAVVPAGRRYVLQVRIDRPASVRLDGAGELPRTAAGDGPGWWEDGHGFTWIRLPAQRAATVVIMTAT
jgi:alpha-glucosidase